VIDDRVNIFIPKVAGKLVSPRMFSRFSFIDSLGNSATGYANNNNNKFIFWRMNIMIMTKVFLFTLYFTIDKEKQTFNLVYCVFSQLQQDLRKSLV